MTNILEAIYNIVKSDCYDIQDMYVSNNRANGMGEALEHYIKDAFADTILENSKQKKVLKHQDIFSWLGTQNNPPDAIIKNGDAIEIKKVGLNAKSIQLNSSHPKAILKSSNPMITEECRHCEEWDCKDLIYCVGDVSKSTLKSLWMVYGNIYSASEETYSCTKTAVSSGIENIQDIVFSPTKELGKIKAVDPLGITSLRIRGMWTIDHPKKVFDYVWESEGSKFELVVIVPLDKYLDIPEKSRLKIQGLQQQNFKITDVKIKNPKNPAKLVDCKLIVFIK